MWLCSARGPRDVLDRESSSLVEGFAGRYLPAMCPHLVSSQIAGDAQILCAQDVSCSRVSKVGPSEIQTDIGLGKSCEGAYYGGFGGCWSGVLEGHADETSIFEVGVLNMKSPPTNEEEMAELEEVEAGIQGFRRGT